METLLCLNNGFRSPNLERSNMTKIDKAMNRKPGQSYVHMFSLVQQNSAMRIFNLSSALASIDEEEGKENDEVFESKASASVLQFTRSIGALNAMSLGVQVMKAKVITRRL